MGSCVARKHIPKESTKGRSGLESYRRRVERKAGEINLFLGEDHRNSGDVEREGGSHPLREGETESRWGLIGSCLLRRCKGSSVESPVTKGSYVRAHAITHTSNSARQDSLEAQPTLINTRPSPRPVRHLGASRA